MLVHLLPLLLHDEEVEVQKPEQLDELLQLFLSGLSLLEYLLLLLFFQQKQQQQFLVGANYFTVYTICICSLAESKW